MPDGSRPDAERPTGGPVADAELVRLLQELRDLRLTLETDLAAAAGALDADHPAVARDIVMGDRLELRGFHNRARDLMADDGHDAASAVVPAGAVVPATRSRSRRRRALLALPAVPLVGAMATTAALALGGAWHGSAAHAPTRTGSSTSSTSTTSTTSNDPVETASGTHRANATLRRLESVIGAGSSPAQILTVANRFHDQVAALLQDSSGAVPDLPEVRTLLAAEQRLLRQHGSPATRVALQASERLSSRLLGRLGSATPPSSQPIPNHPPVSGSSATPSPTPSRRQRHSPSPATSTPTPTKGTPYPVLGTGTPLARRQL